MFKTRLSALVLAIVMVATMFTAFPAIASAADTWTETYSGDEADFTVSGPTSVTKGETFEITFTFDNFADKVSGFDINLYIDTRYVIYDTTYDANKKEVTPPINLVGTAPATWKLIPNGLTEKAYEEAADKSAASMKGINFSASVSDLANDAFSSAFSVTLRLRAVATGTANFEMGFAYGYNGTRGEFPFFEDGGDNSAFDYAIEVVEEGGDATDTTTSEDTTVDTSDVTSDDVTSDDVQEITNIAPEAQYKGEGDDNGTTGSYCEVGAEWNEYHTGKLTDGVIATDASNAQTGLSVEFYNAGFAVGVNKLYFKFDYEVDVREVVGYFNNRNNSQNRGYPSLINVYVGNSEDLAEATLLGEAATTDEGYVRAYSAEGSIKGTYVIFEMTISNPVAVIALTEVEIIGYGDAPVVPDLPKLEAPVLSSSTFKFTYDVPTISWEAVEGAVGYDVYLDGVLTLENTTELSFTPSVATRTNYNASNAYKVTVVAKTDSEDFADSLPSEAAEFIYVDKPTDINGNPLDTADFIIDAGHGGTDPGALGDGGAREEADDNLAMAKAVGERLTALGFTVAYTRTTDVYETVLTKAAKGEAGVFGYYMCFHRNSFSDERALGVETLFRPNDSGSNQAFARLVQDEIMALGIFTNRNIKERTDLTVLNNVTSMPAILMEIGFISNPDDNQRFDTYFNDIAIAVVRGAMVNAGYKTGFEGAVVANGNDYTINDEPLDIHLDLTNYDPENSVLDIMVGIANGLGIKEAAVSVNDGEWITVEPEPPIIIYSPSDFKYPSNIYAYTKDFLGIEAGYYTFKCKLVHAVEGGEIYADETVFLTIHINVMGDPVSVGDVNEDGEVDNLDAALVLQYDAGLIDETELSLAYGDMNEDGVVDNLDAVLMLKAAAGVE